MSFSPRIEPKTQPLIGGWDAEHEEVRRQLRPPAPVAAAETPKRETNHRERISSPLAGLAAAITLLLAGLAWWLLRGHW